MLVAAIIALNLLGLLGVMVAAPILATVALIWNYTMRKMLDLEPWPDDEWRPASPKPSHILVRLRRLWRNLLKRFA